MSTKTDWLEAIPTAPGIYLWRAHSEAPVEPIQVWPCGGGNPWPRYGWAQQELLLAKRMHEPEGIEADAMRGLYLVELGQQHPKPIEEPPFLSPVDRIKAQQREREAQAAAAPQRERKTARKARPAPMPTGGTTGGPGEA